MTNFSDEYNALYRHEKDFVSPTRRFARRPPRPSLPFVGWGTHFFDYDNDGWLDLMVVNGHVYPQLDDGRLDAATTGSASCCTATARDGTFAEVAGELGPALIAAGA